MLLTRFLVLVFLSFWAPALTFAQIKAINLTGWDDHAYDPEVVYKLNARTPVNAWFEYYPFFPEYLYNPPKTIYENLVTKSDIHYTLERVNIEFPDLEWISVFTFWFQSNTDTVNGIKPRYEWEDEIGFNIEWKVAGITKQDLSARTKGSVGGTPNDDGFLWICREIKERGYKLAIYPFVRINDGIFPERWRGEIVPSDIEAWFDAPWGYKNFQRHYAKLLADQGVIPDAFFMGGELIGVTNLAPPTYPAVDKLKEVAAMIDSILPNTLLTYAADWGEYHHNSHFQDGGQLSQLFPEVDEPNYHLDPLWSDVNIDMIGIDAYFPLTESHTNIPQDITQGWFSGRYFDWFPSAWPFNPDSMVTVPPKVANKNLNWFWGNEHYNLQPPTDSLKTEWVPMSKPIWFTEVGYASIHATTVEPYIFPPANPRTSTGETDFEIQCLAFKALDETMGNEPYIKKMFAWNYDARPFPAFPVAKPVWADHANWEKGHWIEGKWLNNPFCGLGSIQIPNFSDFKKDSIEIPININIKSNQTSIDSFQFRFSFDPTVLRFDQVLLGDLTTGYTISADSLDPYTVNIYSFGDNPIMPGANGSIALLKFKVISGNNNLGPLLLWDFNFNRPRKPVSVVQQLEGPEHFVLSQNYPNPFNPETQIRFQLPEATHVEVKIYNTLGQEIRTLVDAPLEGGYHTIRWEGKDDSGNSMPSGIYFYKLKAGDFTQVKKMLLIR